MRLWTIQSMIDWDGLRTTGALRYGPEPESSSCRTAYEWMREQMVKRIGPPPEPDMWPIWAWYWWDGKAKPRPDLRCRWFRLTRGRSVRIEFECPDGSALPFDFNAWFWRAAFIAADEIRAKSLAPGETLHDPRVSELLRTGPERMFDLTWHRRGWPVRPEERSVQATVWEIRMEQVREVTEFGGR